jgi:hypothetical protein
LKASFGILSEISLNLKGVMRRRKKGSVEWLEFELLADIPYLTHGVFLRHGGYSTGPFASLNAGGRIEVDENIEKNREKIKEILGFSAYMTGKQMHNANVEIVPPVSSLVETDCDGLITKEKSLGLLIGHADCQAAIFYDPANHILANVHCGWRGNVKNIYEKTIQKMQTLGSLPKDILVCISPSLGPNASQFINYKTELPESFLEFQFKPLYFNLWEIARHQLEEAGILRHHIEIASICTFQNEKDCFSYRRNKITGHHATVAALK